MKEEMDRNRDDMYGDRDPGRDERKEMMLRGEGRERSCRKARQR